MVAQKAPYKMLGGIVPCPGGWLIVPARLAGVTIVAEEPIVVATLVDVLEFKPKFEAAAIYFPVGFSDEPDGPFRPCDEDARDLVGWPRRIAMRPTPSRAALEGTRRAPRRSSWSRGSPATTSAGSSGSVRPSASSSRSTNAPTSRHTPT